MLYGQGSITKHIHRGTWTGKYLARYRAPDGKQRSKTFARKTDAQKFLAAIQTDKARGTWIDPSGMQIPFDRWAEDWMKSRHNLAAATRARDESLMRIHIISYFGSSPLGRIGPLDARAWVNELVTSTSASTGRPLSPRTIRDCFGLFNGIMRAAAVARLVPEPMATRGVVVLPKVERKRERFLDEAEVERLCAVLPEHYRLFVRTAPYTGCRWQELAGLKRVFLDLDRAQILVHGVLERVGGTVSYRDFPKTEAGRRSITLPPFLVRMLREHLETAPLGEWVFTAPGGGVLRESNFRRPWNKAIEAAGLAPLTFHDLRHTHAAWLIRDNVQPSALQRRLGHKDIGTTLNVYGHLFPNFEAEVVVRLEERFQAAAESPESAKVFRFPGR